MELKAQLQENLQKYEGLVLLKNAIQEAKKTKSGFKQIQNSY